MGQKLTRRELVPVLALAALVLVSYLPTLFSTEFVWDDVIFTDAKPVQEWSGLWQIWFSPTDLKAEAHYWPITYSTFWLEHKLWGFNPTGSHGVNVALHGVNTLLLLRLLRRLPVPGAWFAAGLFAVHPVHAESVAWVIARKDLLATLFTLAAFLTWIHLVERESRREHRPWGLWLRALLLYVAALFSKSVAVTLPAVLLLWHWWRYGRVTVKDGLRLLPLFAAGITFVVVDTAYYASREIISFEYSLVERLLIAARALVFYVAKLFWPANLAVIYPHWDVAVADVTGWLCMAGVLVLLGALWLLRGRISRGPLAVVLFFMVTLLPVLGFVDYGYMQFSFVADRYQYLASAGIIVLFAAAVASLVRGREEKVSRGLGKIVVWAVRGLSAALLLLLGTLTWKQADRYTDRISLFSHIVQLNPRALGAHNNLATGLMDAGRYEEALSTSRIAIRQWPDVATPYDLAGAALIELGKPEEAEQILQEGLKYNHNNYDYLFRLGEAYRRQGKFEEAIPWYQSAIEADETKINAYVGLGDTLVVLERYEEARSTLENALTLSAEGNVLAGIHQMLGTVFLKLGQPEQAKQHLDRLPQQTKDQQTIASQANLQLAQGRFQEALDSLNELALLDPDNPSIHLGVARALSGLERYDEARTRLEQALTLEPSGSLAADVHALLGQTLQALGEPGEVEVHYERALQADPLHEEALVRLGNLRLAQGRFAEALELLQILGEIHPDTASVHGGIGIVLARLGRRTEALAALDRALSLDPSDETLRAERERIRREIE